METEDASRGLKRKIVLIHLFLTSTFFAFSLFVWVGTIGPVYKGLMAAPNVLNIVSAIFFTLYAPLVVFSQLRAWRFYGRDELGRSMVFAFMPIAVWIVFLILHSLNVQII